MAEGLSLHGRKERLADATDLTSDELRMHQTELEAQLAEARERKITRWQEAIPGLLALIRFELDMRDLDSLDDVGVEMPVPELARV
ncbi:hypothetical protein IPM09_05255 [Candidatus Saccharibacteria bacterium]|nr:MAG: hypothetical protein IPM09_05255 [Candidatus Saccharibacteria bacterium]